jgi:DNA-binding winged helix-turn-helix (wHTH) protein/tetratricopeptide (TPR) repeat protein
MSRTTLRFGDCRLDIAARSLTRADSAVELPPTVFDCIAYLVTHRMRAIGRDELVSAVWGKSAISDTMLGKAILAARRAIGDTAEAQAMIRTIPRFGYHFVGDVVEHREGGEHGASRHDAPPDVHTPPVSTSHHRARAPRVFAVVALVAAIAAGLVIVARHFSIAPAVPATSSAVAAPIAAVLPVDIVAGADDAWLRLGLMDLIANQLRAGGVAVMSSDSVMSLVRQNGDAANAAGALRRAQPGARLIAASAAKSGDGWIAHARVDDGSGAARTLDASAHDAVGAARGLADRLLETFGRRPLASATPAQDSLDELMQRSEAAKLADDVDAARALIDAAPPALQALPEVRMRRAQIELRAGHFDIARDQLRALIDAVPAERDAALRARAMVALCNAEGRLGHQDDAIRLCSDAIELASTRADAIEALAIGYNNRAVTHLRQRDFAAAQADFARSRVGFEKLGDVVALTRIDGNEASVAMDRGRPAEALPMFERAASTFGKLGLATESLIAITNEIDALRALLRASDALAASERGWAILPNVHDAGLQNEFKRERAEALALNGRLAEAHALLDALIGEIDPDTDAATLALVRGSAASLELDAGQPALAATLAGQAIAALDTPEYAQARASAALDRVRALVALGRDDEARRAAAAMRPPGDARANPVVDVYADIANAIAAGNVTGRGDEAMTDVDAMLQRALATAGETSLPYLVKLAANAYGERLIAHGLLEPATIVVDRIAPYAATDFDCAVLRARLYAALGQRAPWQDALGVARRLAGERAIPSSVAAFPDASAEVSKNP